jgi:hypothetical protein
VYIYIYIFGSARSCLVNVLVVDVVIWHIIIILCHIIIQLVVDIRVRLY